MTNCLVNETDSTEVEIDCSRPCDDPCEGHVPTEHPSHIPSFHNTYVGKFRTHYPNKYLNYELPCGGSCSCGTRCTLVCNTLSQKEQKEKVLKHGPNYIGTSKKMFYSQYIQSTPGMYTFASKKIPNFRKLDAAKQLCFKTYWCPNK